MPAHVFLALVLGAVLCFVPVVGRVARIATTIAHEVGHCVVVVPFRGRIRRIDLHADGSGEAWVDLGRVPRSVRWAVRIVNLHAGYSAPLWAGALLVTGTLAGDRVRTTVVLAVIGIVALLFVRNRFGLLVVVGFDVLAAWIALGRSEWGPLVVAVVGALFVVDGLRSVLRVAAWTFTGARVRTDFHIAAEEMHAPAVVWFMLFILVNAGAAWLARGPLEAAGAVIVTGVRALAP